MKVTYRGTTPDEIVYVGTCSRCNSVMEAMQHELEHTSSQRDGDLYTAACPVCSSKFVPRVVYFKKVIV